LEDKAVAIAKTVLSDESLLDIRCQLDSDLSPYRSKMSADQIAMLAKRYLDNRVLEREQLPRLSLFYLH
jgi:regulator of sirC expression with transglutaminase-like and TPR domain